MLSDVNLQKIVDFFDLGKIGDVRYLGHASAHNYSVTLNETSYVIRLLTNTHNASDPYTDLHLEITYTSLINQTHALTPTYCSNPDGNYIYEKAGVFACIRPKIIGTLFHEANLTVEHFSNLGQKLATLHTIPLATNLPSRSNWPSDRWLDWARPKIERDFILLDKTILTHPCLQTDWSTFPQTYVHGDCRTNNILITETADIKLFDWEEVSVAAAVTDLGRFLVNVLEQKLLTPDRYTALLHGYTSIRSLTQQEITALPKVVEYMGLMASLWRLIRFHNPSIPYTTKHSLWHQLDLQNWQPPKE